MTTSTGTGWRNREYFRELDARKWTFASPQVDILRLDCVHLVIEYDACASVGGACKIRPAFKDYRWCCHQNQRVEEETERGKEEGWRSGMTLASREE
ncbi:hypothetical protein TNCV_2770551 [Trichonephila clavipes]|nr:hypothetical protein TNCV_2770551 [Trichonephila clavipes]